jgi:hypothetical protein
MKRGHAEYNDNCSLFNWKSSQICIQLTVYLVFLWGIGMEDIEWSNKITEINDSLMLNIKQLKNLHAELFEYQNLSNWMKWDEGIVYNAGYDENTNLTRCF